MTKDDVLSELLKEVRTNFQLLRKAVEVVHNRGEITAGVRGVIELLFEGGAMTVPHMAKLRHVTRQNVQTIIDQMLHQGWVQAHPNPFHKKSMLFELTESGKKSFKDLLKVETANLKKLNFGVPQKRLQEARDILRKLNADMDAYLKQR